MAKFIGSYKAKVDDKGRLIFPSAFKSSMGEGASLRFVVKRSLFAECLEMYAYDEWERDSEAVRKLCTAYTKLLFPHAESAEDIDPKEFDTYCLQPALSMRGIIREQMGFADIKEAGKVMPDIKTKGLCD